MRPYGTAPRQSGFFLSGLEFTIRLALLTLVCAIVVSVVIGLMSVSQWRGLRVAALCYVEFWRDIPLLVNLLFIYFGAPLIGVPLKPFTAALLSLTLWGGANGAEIVRGGINAVGRTSSPAPRRSVSSDGRSIAISFYPRH